MVRRPTLWFAFTALAGLAACSSNETGSTISTSASSSSGGIQLNPNASDVPINGTPKDLVDQFYKGDAVFDLPFRDSDGLGPLYVRTSCGDCHENGSRGPGLVQKMAVVAADGVTASADQSELPFGHTIRPYVTAGAVTPILAPTGVSNVLVSSRVGPPVLGRGYMEAIADSEIERLEKEQSKRTDGIHGVINRVTYASETNTETDFPRYTKGQQNLIGRFGLKARIASLDEFAADALQGDMGLTSPMRPDELPNPDGLTDDLKPGVDLDLEHINKLATYMRLIAIPPRVANKAGEKAFAAANCNVCHAPSLATRSDYPIAELAGIEAEVFTDFLLHDMGPKLADGMTDGTSTSRLWRTAPLIGTRFSRIFLHDGRAGSIEEAILAHDDSGSEGSGSVALFNKLSAADRAALLDYVGAL